MIREEIVEGLKRALSRGEQLQKAMMSFYNAGYTKQEIEDSAKALQPQIQQPAQPQTQQPQPAQFHQAQSTQAQQPVKQQTQAQTQQKSQILDQQPKIEQSQQTPQNMQEQIYQTKQKLRQRSLTQARESVYAPKTPEPKTVVVQRVSEYGKKPNIYEYVLIFFLVFLLLLLVGVILAIFLFKNELLSYLSSFLGLLS